MCYFAIASFPLNDYRAAKDEVTLNEQDPLAGVTTPADALRMCMEWRGWSQPDLAYVLGVNAATVNQIINGKRGISPDMAKALAVAFNVPVQSIAAVQAQWELDRAREPDPAVKARARVQSEYPLREMIKRGWLSGDDLEKELCGFFDVRNVADVPHLNHAT